MNWKQIAFYDPNNQPYEFRTDAVEICGGVLIRDTCLIRNTVDLVNNASNSLLFIPNLRIQTTVVDGKEVNELVESNLPTSGTQVESPKVKKG